MRKNKAALLTLVFIFLAVCGLGVFAFSAEAQAATYYVATNGSDSSINNGSVSSPWATFSHAISQAASGDTIIAKAGIYNQTITVNKSNITIQGTLDATGDRLSIIDPYTNVSGDWISDGDGVWKKNFDYPVYAMNVQVAGTRYNIMRLCQTTDDSPISGGPAGEFCGVWSTWLRENDEKKIWTPGETPPAPPVNLWDIFETLYTCLNTAPYTCYLRFRNEATAMNNLDLYAANNAHASITVNASNVTVKDLDIRAVAKGISIGGIWGTETSVTKTVIDNNRITLGKIKIWVTGGSTGATISNNVITDFDYAREHVKNLLFNRGAWYEHSANEYLRAKTLQWWIEKYRMSPDGNAYVNTGVLIEGDDTTVDSNNIYMLHNGITTGLAGTEEILRTTISNNQFSNTSGGAVGFSKNATATVKFNTFNDVMTGIRPMYWGGYKQGTNGTNSSVLYIYGNKFWLPLAEPYGLGSGILFHHDTATTTSQTKAGSTGTAWIYHNSFSGGNMNIQMNTPSTNSMERVRIVNNIMSSDYGVINGNVNLCSYNWVSGPISPGSCANTGTHNINGGAGMMSDWNTSTTIHDFSITGSSAVGAGINISQSFLGYSALPGFTAGYFSGSRPNMGAVQSSADVNSDTHVNIKDIQACIKVITQSNMTYQDQCRVLAAPDLTTNIKDIQVIIREIIR